jgi:hypothetical protein
MRYRHKKRGTTYEIITHDASMQCSAVPDFEGMFEDDNWTVYRNVDTGAIYVRPTDEFMDGRFERIEENERIGYSSAAGD